MLTLSGLQLLAAILEGIVEPISTAYPDTCTNMILFTWLHLMHARLDVTAECACLCSVLEPSQTLTLAEKGGAGAEVIRAAPGFRLLATMNPGGDYGKRELSPALSNRFTQIWVPPITEEQELAAILASRITGAVGKALYMVKADGCRRWQPWSCTPAMHCKGELANPPTHHVNYSSIFAAAASSSLCPLVASQALPPCRSCHSKCLFATEVPPSLLTC